MEMQKYVVVFFIKNKDVKDKNHCHYAWKYKSGAHSICNLKYNVPKQIPIVFHNESNYDC